MFFLIVGGVYTFFTTEEVSTRFMVFFGIVGGVAGYLGYLHLFVPFNAKKHYQSYKALQETMSIDVPLDESGSVKIITESGENKIKVKDMVKWRENNKLLLIYLSPYVYYIIPKRIGEQAEHLRELLIDTIGNAT